MPPPLIFQCFVEIGVDLHSLQSSGSYLIAEARQVELSPVWHRLLAVKQHNTIAILWGGGLIYSFFHLSPVQLMTQTGKTKWEDQRDFGVDEQPRTVHSRSRGLLTFAPAPVVRPPSASQLIGNLPQ